MHARYLMQGAQQGLEALLHDAAMGGEARRSPTRSYLAKGVGRGVLSLEGGKMGMVSWG